VHERYRQTDRQTTDGRAIACSEREREFTFAKNVTWLGAICSPFLLPDVTWKVGESVVFDSGHPVHAWKTNHSAEAVLLTIFGICRTETDMRMRYCCFSINLNSICNINQFICTLVFGRLSYCQKVRNFSNNLPVSCVACFTRCEI